MEGLSEEKVQKLVDLTIDQQRAWTSLVRAVNRCKKEGIMFYSVLDGMGAVNGKNVHTIHSDADSGLSGVPSHIFTDERWMGFAIDYPSITMACSFADDQHYVELKTD